MVPKPEGFTEEQGKKRDEIARALLRDRHFTGRGTMERRQRAYAIATAQVEGMPHSNPHPHANPPDIIHEPGRLEGEWLPAEFVDREESDAELGDVEETGFYRYWSFKDADRFAMEKKYPNLANEIKKLVGAIAREDSQGFVRFEWYEEKRNLDRDWNYIEGIQTGEKP